MAAKKRKHGLGRGLNALINDHNDNQKTEVPANTGNSMLTVSVDKINKNQFQPRHVFDETALQELAQSISEHGVLQPLIVRTAEDGYELIAGERRLAASIEAGLTEVPVIVIEALDSEALELALVENLQREDLNILEEAEGYQMLVTRFGLTQEQIAERVGKARVSVTNTMRILSLPHEIKAMLSAGSLTAGHAKIISGLDMEEEQLLYARKTVNENLSVRNLEKLIQKVRRMPRKPRASHDDIPGSHITYLSEKLHSHFSTAVRITSCKTYANGKKGKGTVELDFYSNEDLDRILDLFDLEFE